MTEYYVLRIIIIYWVLLIYVILFIIIDLYDIWILYLSQYYVWLNLILITPRCTINFVENVHFVETFQARLQNCDI